MDYILVSTDIMTCVTNFEILNFETSHHLPPSCSLAVGFENTVHENANKLLPYTVFKWSEEHREKYISMLNDELSENMCGLFYCVVEDDVNDAVTVLNNILSHAGDMMKVTRKPVSAVVEKRQNSNQEWWDKD